MNIWYRSLMAGIFFSLCSHVQSADREVLIENEAIVRQLEVMTTDSLQEHLWHLIKDYRIAEKEYLSQFDSSEPRLMMARQQDFEQANLNIKIEMNAVRDYLADMESFIPDAEGLTSFNKSERLVQAFRNHEKRYLKEEVKE